MNRQELKTILQQTIYTVDGQISQGRFKSLDPEIRGAIFHYTENCQTTKLSERIHWILNDLTNYPIQCRHPACSKPVTRFKGQYRGIFCSSKCNSKYQLLVSPNPFSGETGRELRRTGMLKKYGVDHNMKTKASLDKRKQTYTENYGVEHPLKSAKVFKKVRIANEQAGRWLPEDQIKLFALYRRKVLHFTNQQDLTGLANYELRGHSKTPGAYSLDHKFSCQEGFKNNIPPYIIGSIVNLEFIPNKDNSKKKHACSITKEELFEQFNTICESILK